MTSDKLNEVTYRTNYDYYLKLEEEYLAKAEEMREKRMEVLIEWKKSKQVKEYDDL